MKKSDSGEPAVYDEVGANVEGEDFGEGSGLSPEVEEVANDDESYVGDTDLEQLVLGEERVGNDEVRSETSSGSAGEAKEQVQRPSEE